MSIKIRNVPIIKKEFLTSKNVTFIIEFFIKTRIKKSSSIFINKLIFKNIIYIINIK